MSGFLFHDLRIHRFLLSPVLSGFYPAFFPDGSVYPLLRQSDVESLPAEDLLPSKSLFPDEQKEQKIKNGLITFKISHVAAIKQYNSGEREEEKHHEICFRRP
jgi:hypothetical protein